MTASIFYITTPIYYVNDKPHIGHAYTTVLADVLSRYNRLLKKDTFFLTGTDEHGQKVFDAAEKLGRTLQEHCDITVKRFLELWEKLEITYDYFIRTTHEDHTFAVQEILQDLFDRDLIYKGSYKGWYCVPCERFFTEKDLVEGKCPECSRDVKKIEEPNYFFKMGQYGDWLMQYIEEHPDFIQPDFRKNEVLGFLKKGPLGDLCISRPKTRLSWGIELPFDRDYVCYVWFDALINYISGVGYLKDNKMFQKWWPATYHLIGKDILITHAVYWPIMLKAMRVEMPHTIFAHGWWLTRDTKMSKSLGNIVNPMDIADKYGVDPFRYYLIAEMKLGKDCNFTEESFIRRYNAELANDLGNLVNRVMSMIEGNCDGRIPEPHDPTEKEIALADLSLETADFVEGAIQTLALDKMVDKIIDLVRAVNKYFEESAPWKMLKDHDIEGFERVLYNSSESLRVISGLLQPIMPGKMECLRALLGIKGSAADIQLLKEWNVLEPGIKVGDIIQLFPRIEVKKEVEKDSMASKINDKGTISFEEFKKVKLKTALVVKAEKVENSDKLLKLEIDLGNEKRTIVAGIAKDYAPEQIQGKTIVVVSNLEKAKIFGIESDGMLLAADTGDGYTLVISDRKAGPGCSVS